MSVLKLLRNEPAAIDLAPGEVLTYGQESPRVYIVLSGKLHVRTCEAPGVAVGPGEVLGDAPALQGCMSQPRLVVAAEPARLAAMSQRRFRFLLDEMPHFASGLRRLRKSEQEVC